MGLLAKLVATSALDICILLVNCGGGRDEMQRFDNQ